MATGKFTADPGRIRRGIEMMEALPEQTSKIADDFVSDIQNYRGWAGYGDDFAHQALPKFDANNEACSDALMAIRAAFTGLTLAVLGNLHQIEGTSATSDEMIARQVSRLDGLGGDSTGGGRH